MMQQRVIAGKSMEESTYKDGWVKSPTKPKLKWRGEGKNNIEKIIKSNYNVKQFSTLENITLNKYDIYNTQTKKTREVKSYNINEVKKWTLYSEPYFKVATRSQCEKISQEKYNSFLNDFYTHALQTGLLNFIQEQMTHSNEGIVFKDGFVPLKNLEFRTVIVNKQWKGYDRIQIQFRVI